MRRILLIIGIILIFVLPIAIFVIQRMRNPIQPFVSWKLIQQSPIATRYSVESVVPNYTINLLDTKFFDYIAENVGIFNPDAVVDPEIYQDGRLFRHTITRIKFVIVPSITKLLVAISGQKDFAAYGDYLVEGDTLVLRVSLNSNEIVALSQGQYNLEDTFLRASMEVMYYAHGLTNDPKNTGEVFRNIQEGIKQYLYNGILPWPIKITQVK